MQEVAKAFTSHVRLHPEQGECERVEQHPLLRCGRVGWGDGLPDGANRGRVAEVSRQPLPRPAVDVDLAQWGVRRSPSRAAQAPPLSH